MPIRSTCLCRHLLHNSEVQISTLNTPARVRQDLACPPTPESGFPTIDSSNNTKLWGGGEDGAGSWPGVKTAVLWYITTRCAKDGAWSAKYCGTLYHPHGIVFASNAANGVQKKGKKCLRPAAAGSPVDPVQNSVASLVLHTLLHLPWAFVDRYLTTRSFLLTSPAFSPSPSLYELQSTRSKLDKITRT